MLLLLASALMTMVADAGAQAVYPEDGWWWNPEQPGRGYLMERQDDILFIASFHYSASGDPEWLTITGKYVPELQPGPEIGTLDGQVYVARHGQCIGCPYASPVETVSAQDPATLTFHSNRSGTLVWPAELSPQQATV